MKSFVDRFSNVSYSYDQYRPGYPLSLYQFLFSKVASFDFAWDAGTGTGQVARALAKKFKDVIATDVSANQIAHAQKIDNISYRVGRAEQTSIPEGTIDLITVAQAVHWFDIPCFLNEVRRVSKPAAILAIWGYGLFRINRKVDALIDEFYHETIGEFWDPERNHIDRGYQTLDIDFDEFEAPEFQIESSWTIDQLSGYLNTWSAVQKFLAKHQSNPVDPLVKRLKAINIETPILARNPILFRIGRVNF